MFEGKYSKVLTIGLIIGIIVIVAVLIFVGFTVIKNNNLKSDAEDAVEHFQGQVNNTQTNTMTNETTDNVAPIIDTENIINNNGTDSSNTNTYKGFPMVGTIEIPRTGLKSPILEDASKSAIEVAIAIYDGPGLNKVGNTILVGHNYRNGTFFSDNKNIVEGDKIYITDNTADKVEYVVYKTYITSPEDSDYMDRDTNGAREISLTTCTDDTKSRLIIWAKAD